VRKLDKILHKFARFRGYDLLPRDRFGADLAQDFRRMYGARPVEMIFDVGANEGQTAVELARAFPRATVHSFEPFNRAFDALRRATLPFQNVKPVNLALGDAASSRTLFVNKSSPTTSLLPMSAEAAAFVPGIEMAATGTAEIQVATLDDYCAREQIGFIDLLKMDVQGYEQRVLRGGHGMLSQQKVASVFTEVLFAPLYDGQAYFQDLYADLWKCGFRLVQLYNPALNEQQFLSWCDALFIHPEALARRPRG
jgi:FkbM family methyltransferase